MEIVYFTDKNERLYVTEMGYSHPRRIKRLKTNIRDCYILHVVMSGTCHFCDFDVVPGEAFLIAKGVPHSFYVDPEYAHYWVAFDGQGAPRLLEELGISVGAHQKFSLPHPDYAYRLLEEAFDACKEEDGHEVASAAVISLLMLLGYCNLPRSGNEGHAQTAKNFMDTNYHLPITMQEIAEVVHICEKHLCRKFKMEYEIAPQQYLYGVRMKKAGELLRRSEMSVKEISGSVGYQSQLTFSTAFKKHYGVCPTEYRKQMINR
jgi:AraC-like DNA-binding protein